MSLTVWFTGLSGSGKTTLSRLVEERLKARGEAVVRLDGDELRSRPGWKLGFTREDRLEQIRRLAAMALEENRQGRACLVAAISPFAIARDEARRLIGNFVEVHCAAPLDVLASRDVKGLYARALAGEISEFTGVSSPYEPPQNPEVTARAYAESPAESADKVMEAIGRLGQALG